MNTTDAVNAIPAGVRRWIYLALFAASLLLTATGVFLAHSPWGSPWWVDAALQSVGVLVAPFGVLAAVNVPKQNKPVPDPLADDEADHEAAL